MRTKIKTKHLEIALLILVFTALVYLGPMKLLNFNFHHEFPVGYYASDAVWHYVEMQHIKDTGSYSPLPNYMEAGYTDVVGFQPPLFFYLAAYTNKFVNIPLWDWIILLAGLFMAATPIAMYLCIRHYSVQAAVLSLPLSIFLFVLPFYTGLLFGLYNFVVGNFFMMLSLLLFIKKKWVLLALSLAATAYTHTTEYMFIMFFILAYSAALCVLKEVGKKELWKTAGSAFSSLAISSPYLIIFYGVFVKATGGGYTNRLFTIIKTAGLKVIHFSDFGWFIMIVLIAGIILFATNLVFNFGKHINKIPMMFGLFMLIISYLNYVGIPHRPFQARIMWPVYFMPFFGLAWYTLLKLVSIKGMLVPLTLSIALFIGVVLIHYEPVKEGGLLNEWHWNAFKWIQKNTEEDAKVLVFYGDTFDQTAQMLLTKRETHYIDVPDYVSALQKETIQREYITKHIFNNDIQLAYKKGWFSFGYHMVEDNVTDRAKRDICTFDYWWFDKESMYYPELAQYNIAVANVLLQYNHTLVYGNELSVIIKNEKKEKCLEV